MAAWKFYQIVRSFSTSGGQTQLVKTPIAVFGIGGRYATAMYSAAVKLKEIDKIEADFLKFQNALDSDKKFREIVKDPTIKKPQKSAALSAAAKHLSLSKSATNAILLISENGRFKNFSEILFALKTIMAAHRGEIICEVTSAKPLTDTQKQEIETALKKFIKGKQNILMTTKIDPKILGGLLVSIGDKFLDMSIASKIKKYKEIIENVA